MNPDLAALRQEITRLKADFTSLRRWIQEQVAVTAQEGREAKEDRYADGNFESTDPELDQAQAEEEAKLEWQRYIETIDTSFQEESADASWSAEATDAIYSTLENENLSATSLEDVECRSRLCRLTVRHDEPMAASQFGTFLLPQLASMLPSATLDHIDEGGGKSTTIVYLAREGYSLPSPESGE